MRWRHRMKTRAEIEDRLRAARETWLAAVNNEDRRAEVNAMDDLNAALKDLHYLLHAHAQ